MIELIKTHLAFKINKTKILSELTVGDRVMIIWAKLVK